MRKRHASKQDVIIHWIGVALFSAVVGSGFMAMMLYGILKETEHNKFYIVGENNERH